MAQSKCPFPKMKKEGMKKRCETEANRKCSRAKNTCCAPCLESGEVCMKIQALTSCGCPAPVHMCFAACTRSFSLASLVACSSSGETEFMAPLTFWILPFNFTALLTHFPLRHSIQGSPPNICDLEPQAFLGDL